MEVLLSIGDFSKMTSLSIKALRHYHDVGLLEPVEVDPSSGYRRYGAGQVATAQAIRRFRDLELPIEQIRQVLGAADDAERTRVLVEHLTRMQEQLARTQASVESLQALLTHGPPPRAEVELRHVPVTPALATTQVVGPDDCADWLERAHRVLKRRADALDLAIAGPEGAVWSDGFFEDGAGGVTAFVPLTVAPRGWARDAVASVEATGAVELVDLPAVNVAVLVHDGPFADVDQTYGALGTVVAERGIGAGGPIRELYPADGGVEVCWPVSVGAAR